MTQADKANKVDISPLGTIWELTKDNGKKVEGYYGRNGAVTEERIKILKKEIMEKEVKE